MGRHFLWLRSLVEAASRWAGSGGTGLREAMHTSADSAGRRATLPQSGGAEIASEHHERHSP